MDYITLDLIAVLAIEFKLTEEDLNQNLPSGRQKSF
ncbi:MAG: winged helix-turn-helix domain-containing protein [Prevotellaceae bacterium]|nr:winged helix-turn-helix domain-containing protein [Prevotellaceae bacterium]